MVRAHARMLGAANLQEAATALVNELVTVLGLRNAYVGVVASGASRLIATAHAAIPDRHDPTGPLVAAAMDEAIDQAATIAFPASAPVSELLVSHAHAALARRAGVRVLTVPMPAGEGFVGALLLEQDADTDFSPQQRATIEQIATLGGAVIELRQAAESPLPQRLRARATKAASSSSRRALIVGGAILIVAALVIPLPGRLTAEARIEGEIQRSLVAPAEGYIEEAFVRPGDTVRRDQILVRLADRELRLERRKLESELAQHENAFAGAQSKADRNQMVQAHSRGDEANARIMLVDNQLDRSVIRAPLDGVVLTGDLTQAQGRPVQRGEVLLVLAPLARYRLMIEVDERDISHVKPGAHGQLALSALPESVISFAVKRIMPVTTEREGRHFVEVEAHADAPPAAAQPGMRGYARIEVPSAPLLAQLTDRLRGWLALRWWAWTGL